MHHNDAANLDPRTDITDLYVFQKPGDLSKSILILNVNPEAPTRADSFDPRASYELKIDTNDDFQAEVGLHVLFSPPDDGRQTAALYLATGEAAREAGPVGTAILQRAPVSFTHEAHILSAGPYRFFAGLRSDPFFADPDGFVNNMQWTGRDGWWGKNVFAIVLEVPNRILGSQPRLGVWGRTMIPVHGAFTPVNQMGRPGTNVFRQGADTNLVPPVQQRERFLPGYVAMFQSFGYTGAEANELALQWLPDILPYDFTSPVGYPNGRRPDDDVVDRIVEIMTRGRMKDDLITAHSDYLPGFPYLGIPHEAGR